MDPNAALALLIDALIDGGIHNDFSDAKEHAENLATWLGSGGFVPADYAASGYTDTVWDFAVRPGEDTVNHAVGELQWSSDEFTGSHNTGYWLSTMSGDIRAVQMLLDSGYWERPD